MNNILKHVLPNNAKIRFTYAGQKLDTKFHNKDKIEDQLKHDLVYYSKCPEPICNENYLDKLEGELLKD